MLFIAADPAEVKSEGSPKVSQLAAVKSEPSSQLPFCLLVHCSRGVNQSSAHAVFRARVSCRRLNRTVMMAERPRQDDNPADKLGAAVEDKLEGFVEVGDLLQCACEGAVVHQPRPRVVMVCEVWAATQQDWVAAQAKGRALPLRLYSAGLLHSSIPRAGPLAVLCCWGIAGLPTCEGAETNCCCTKTHHAGAECRMAEDVEMQNILGSARAFTLGIWRAAACWVLCRGLCRLEHA